MHLIINRQACFCAIFIACYHPWLNIACFYTIFKISSKSKLMGRMFLTQKVFIVFFACNQHLKVNQLRDKKLKFYHTLLKTRFGAAFLGVALFKNAASGCCLATFIKRGYRPALKLHFVMLKLRLAG